MIWVTTMTMTMTLTMAKTRMMFTRGQAHIEIWLRYVSPPPGPSRSPTYLDLVITSLANRDEDAAGAPGGKDDGGGEGFWYFQDWRDSVKGKGMIKVAVPAAVPPRLHENSSSATLFLVAVFVAAQELVPVRIFHLFFPQCEWLIVQVTGLLPLSPML